MRVSLRFVLSLVVLVCLCLGLREARRSYHWHRNLPVQYHFSNEFAHGFPRNVEVSFRRSDIDRVQLAAESRLVATARQVFQQCKNEADSQFCSLQFLHTWEYRSHRFRKRVALHFREFLQRDVSMSSLQRTQLVTSWLCFGDSTAGDEAARLLDSDDLETVEQMIAGIKRVASRYPQAAWPRDHEGLHGALVNCFENFPTEIAKLSRDLQIQAAVPVFKQKIAELSLDKHFEDLGRQDQRVVEFTLQLLACVAALSPDEAVFEKLVELRPFLVLRDANDSDADSFGIERILFSMAYSSALEHLARSGDELLRAKVSRFAFELNDFKNAVRAATGENESEMRWIFENRNFNAGLERFADRYAHGPVQWRNRLSVKKLVHPRSGFESGFWMNDFVDRLGSMPEGFAIECLTELMEEGYWYAYEQSGQLLQGMHAPGVVRLLLLFLDGPLPEELLNSLKEASEDQWMSLIRLDRFELFKSLYLISPADAAAISGQFRKGHEEMLMLGGLPEIEALNQLLASYGMETEQVDVDVVGGPKKKLALEQQLVQAFQQRGRHNLSAGVSTGNVPSQVSWLVEGMGDAFELDCVAEAIAGESRRVQVQLATSDRVYRFNIDPNVDNEQCLKGLVDVLNHILDRERIEDRLIPFVDSERDLHVFFGSPDLFECLESRFGFTFLAGAEGYLIFE